MSNELSSEDTAFYEARKQKKTAALKALRVTINAAIAEAKTIAGAEFMHGAGVDDLSSAIHELKQARMWAGEALGVIGHRLPVEYRDEAQPIEQRSIDHAEKMIPNGTEEDPTLEVEVLYMGKYYKGTLDFDRIDE